MKRVLPILFAIQTLLASCDSNPVLRGPPARLEQIAGRYSGEHLYQIKVPIEWERIQTDNPALLQDTMKPICQFSVREGSEAIRITIHNFPCLNPEERIPPMAQIARWKRQFDAIDTSRQAVKRVSFNGFVGYLYEGNGKIHDSNTAMLAYALQIGQEHYRILSRPKYDPEMRSCVTIKAIGSVPLMEKQRHAIQASAESFELVKEIPQG